MFKERMFSLLNLGLMSGLLLSADLLANEHGVDAFVSIGSIFSEGYAQLGAGFDLGHTEGLRFSAGPQLGLGFGQNLFLADVGGFARAVHRIALPKDYNLDVYLKAPLGLTFASRDKFAIGFHMGLMPGVAFFFKPKLATFLELGFLHHSLFSGLNTHSSTGIFSVGISVNL